MARLAGLVALLPLAACATATAVPPLPDTAQPGWTAVAASTRPVGLGLPGGARLADGVRFAGGVELVLDEASPLHSLSDLKLVGEHGFVSVTDAGDLVRGRLVLDGRGELAGVEGLAFRRLTLLDGSPIVDKTDGDAEGLAITGGGDLLISFERDHRIWTYGPIDSLRWEPEAVARPDFAFTLNDGMEGIAAAPGGWRVAGESGGVWRCTPRACSQVVAPPQDPLPDSEYRITGMDRDPAGDWFVVQRLYRPPVDARAQVRRMAEDGALGPVLIELKLPGTTDNFEGIAAAPRGDGVRLYMLSDDNGADVQRTLLLAFDVRPAR
ncbi:Tat pathway signal protein [Brevundimonas sp. Root1279]|nr:Tat pathway signal protein [Brevundimonas sp. Root1279]